MDDQHVDREIDKEMEDQEFWDLADEQLKLQHGRKAEIWLAMLEDPDPDDLIFDYQRIIRRMAFARGYVRALIETGNLNINASWFDDIGIDKR